MKAIKLIALPVLGLVLIAVLLVFLLLGNIDDLIKSVVEEVGSKVTQTKVTLDSAHLDLKSGKGEISGLTIGNPEGYESDYAFQLDHVVLSIDPASLSGSVFVISEISIDGAKLIAEQKGADTNLSKLMDNISASSQETSAKPADAEEQKSETDVRLMIEKFAFINTAAKILMEGEDEKPLKLPDIRRTNIGDKNKGLTPEQLANEILGSVVREVASAVTEYIKDLARNAIEEKMGSKDKKKSLKSLFKRGD